MCNFQCELSTWCDWGDFLQLPKCCRNLFHRIESTLNNSQFLFLLVYLHDTTSTKSNCLKISFLVRLFWVFIFRGPDYFVPKKSNDSLRMENKSQSEWLCYSLIGGASPLVNTYFNFLFTFFERLLESNIISSSTLFVHPRC